MEKKALVKGTQGSEGRSLRIFLTSEAKQNEFLVRVARMEITPTEMNVPRDVARMNNVPIKRCNQGVAKASLTAYLMSTFNFLGAELDRHMGSMIITDILTMYSWMSPVEIVKAIHEGRQNQGDLYGKLSGKHVLQWLQDYDSNMQQDIAQYHQNKKYQRNAEVDQLIEAALENHRKEQRPERTHAEKVEALKDRYEVISEYERKRREYCRAWDLEKHGDYREYMEAYNKKI